MTLIIIITQTVPTKMKSDDDKNQSMQKGSLINSSKLSDFKNISSFLWQICRTIWHQISYSTTLFCLLQNITTLFKYNQRDTDTNTSLHVNCYTILNVHEVIRHAWCLSVGNFKLADAIGTNSKGRKSEIFGQTMCQLIPHCDFPPFYKLKDTQTSRVNIKTELSSRGRLDTLRLSAHPFSFDTFSSGAMVCGDGFPFL